MSKWIDAPDLDRQQSAYIVASDKNISEVAVEKDWWVTAILKSLFSLSPAPYMFFKGGTSLSKGWNIIDRFSEDIDIALYREFYFDVLGKGCAKAATNNQIKNLRIVNRDYILGVFVDELRAKLVDDGLGECKVVPITQQKDGSPIDHDSDPAVIEVYYPIKVNSDQYVRPVVKIEVSCLSMKEPYEVKDMGLYREIIAHRQRFYHVGGVNYELNNHTTISFCPEGDLRDKMRLDYEAMKTAMIYGDKLPFELLIARLEQLQERFRNS